MSDIDPIALGLIVGIVICGVMIVHVLSNIKDIVAKLNEQENKKECSLHKWIYVYTDQRMEHMYMVCSTCGFRAGSNNE